MSTHLAYVALGRRHGGGALVAGGEEGQALVFACQSVGGVDLSVATRAECGVVGAAEDARLRRLAGAAQHLHEPRRLCRRRRRLAGPLSRSNARGDKAGRGERSARTAPGRESNANSNGACVRAGRGLWWWASGMRGWRCGIMEARGLGRNGNGMDSWRGRGGGDEAGDVAGSCSTRRRGLVAAQCNRRQNRHFDSIVLTD